MKTYTATVTKRSQVTIPAKVLRVLGLGPSNRVVFTIENGRVEIQAEEYSLESLMGSIPPLREPRGPDELMREAKDEKAERTVAEWSE